MNLSSGNVLSSYANKFGITHVKFRKHSIALDSIKTKQKKRKNLCFYCLRIGDVNKFSFNSIFMALFSDIVNCEIITRMSTKFISQKYSLAFDKVITRRRKF